MTNTPTNLKQIEDLYLDYTNNYLTIEKFAEDKGLTLAAAQAVIGHGRKINDLRSIKPDLHYWQTDEGFCRVYFKHQRLTTGTAYYCLQDDGRQDGVQLYRCSPPHEGYCEPSHRINFTKRFVIFEKPQPTSELHNKVIEWINKYEADFKLSVADMVTEQDEVNNGNT